MSSQGASSHANARSRSSTLTPAAPHPPRCATGRPVSEPSHRCEVACPCTPRRRTDLLREPLCVFPRVPAPASRHRPALAWTLEITVSKSVPGSVGRDGAPVVPRERRDVASPSWTRQTARHPVVAAAAVDMHELAADGDDGTHPVGKHACSVTLDAGRRPSRARPRSPCDRGAPAGAAWSTPCLQVLRRAGCDAALRPVLHRPDSRREPSAEAMYRAGPARAAHSWRSSAT